MNQQNEDNILNRLYQDANQEQPPAALDDLILKHAQYSSASKISKQRLNNWQPWLAAASVVLVIPMIWLLTQNQDLTNEMAPIQDTEIHPAKAKKTLPKAESAAQESGLDAEQSEINVKRSRISTEPTPIAAPVPTLDAPQASAEQNQRSIDEKSINQQSLKANQAMLMDEFKAKKKTIKQSNMEPIMALELQQFHQYIEQGQFESAKLLLDEMIKTYPDFEFQDLINQLNSEK